MIPKILHQIWIQGYNELPEKYKDYIEIWKELHSEYEYNLWDDIKLIEFIENNFPQYLEHYKNSNMTNKSNLGRYFLMNKIGGVYLDIDTYPIKNIGIFHDMNYDIIMTKRNSNLIKYNAATSFSKPNIKFWIDIVEFALNRTDIKPLPIEPFGVVTLAKFIRSKISNYNHLNIWFSDTKFFNEKNITGDDEQYVIHKYDFNWKKPIENKKDE